MKTGLIFYRIALLDPIDSSSTILLRTTGMNNGSMRQQNIFQCSNTVGAGFSLFVVHLWCSLVMWYYLCCSVRLARKHSFFPVSHTTSSILLFLFINIGQVKLHFTFLPKPFLSLTPPPPTSFPFLLLEVSFLSLPSLSRLQNQSLLNFHTSTRHVTTEYSCVNEDKREYGYQKRLYWNISLQ